MRSRLPFAILFALLSLCLANTMAFAQAVAAPASTREAAIVDSATDVLVQVMAIPGRSIPANLLSKAEGVAIIPDMIKGGFIVGVRHGRGVVVTRDEAGKWKTPMFVTITGASVGWQAGLQGTDLVLVFCTKNSLQNLLRGKFTIGANASAAAGPVGRDAQAATDGALKAEILSYSRSRGLFAGVALDGAVLNVDQSATNAYYQPPGTMPVSATRLQTQLASYTPTVNPGQPSPQPSGAVAATPAPADPRQVRAQLAASARQLATILDPSWQQYLALPAEVYAGDRAPSANALQISLQRYNAIAGDVRYRNLAQRVEFRNTWSLLSQYTTLIQSATAQTLALPPPPR